MPGKLLCLDIGDDAVCAVQVQSGLKGYRVLACAHAAIEDGRLDNALDVIFQEVDVTSDIYRVTIPADRASYRNLQMPFKDEKKIRQTLAFEIESMVPFPIDEVVVDFLTVDRAEQSKILAVSLRKDFVKECLDRLKAYGIELDLLEVRCIPLVSWLLKRQATPEDGLLVDIGSKRGTMVFFSRRRINLIRTFALDQDSSRSSTPSSKSSVSTAKVLGARVEVFCRESQNTIHAFRWNKNDASPPQKIFVTGPSSIRGIDEMIGRFFDLPAERVNVRQDKRVVMDKEIAEVWNPRTMDHALALALREERKDEGLNFLRGEFEARARYSGLKKGIRKVSVAMILILCFLMADLGADYYIMKKRYNMLDRRIREIYRETFPGAARIVDPLKQMEIQLNAVKRSSGSRPGVNSEVKAIDILRDISVRIPDSLDVRLNVMVIGPENVRISGETDTFNTVDSIKGRLESSPLYEDVVISSANLDRSGSRVQFEVRMERK